MNKKIIFGALLICLLAFGAVLVFGQTSPSVRWEYRTVSIMNYDSLEATLNRESAQGWEFIGAPGHGSTLIFKRQTQ